MRCTGTRTTNAAGRWNLNCARGVIVHGLHALPTFWEHPVISKSQQIGRGHTFEADRFFVKVSLVPIFCYCNGEYFAAYTERGTYDSSRQASEPVILAWYDMLIRAESAARVRGRRGERSLNRKLKGEKT